ncbi:MAG: HAMP domain-containing sensor histidine kinase, partial [Bacteroidota bacterium]
NFRWNILIRVTAIVALSITLAWVLVETNWFFTPLVVSATILIVAGNLVYYTERTNKDLTQFLLSIKQGGFTSSFKNQKRGGSQKGLSKAFNDVIHEFQKISIEKETQYLYLQTLNENIGVSIISFDENGNIELMNPAAKALLKKPYLKNISGLTVVDKTLYKATTEMESGEKRVIKSFIDQEMQQLSVQVKDFVIQEKGFRLALFQDINAELDQKEIEAWQKLTRVLTHEIMNSVTPIASLSTAVNQLISNPEAMDTMSIEDKKDIITSLKTIEDRSKGLIHFVGAYKNFSRIPELSIEKVDIVKLVERIVHLLQPDLGHSLIELNVMTPKSLEVKADNELLEQVLINLVKNAIEALNGKRNGRIEVSANKKGAKKCEIKITDNGPGITDEVLERIFIPFYTTKKSGTGVGLSFAKQIIKLHGGELVVRTELGIGTTFKIVF